MSYSPCSPNCIRLLAPTTDSDSMLHDSLQLHCKKTAGGSLGSWGWGGLLPPPPPSQDPAVGVGCSHPHPRTLRWVLGHPPPHPPPSQDPGVWVGCSHPHPRTLRRGLGHTPTNVAKLLHTESSTEKKASLLCAGLQEGSNAMPIYTSCNLASAPKNYLQH